jgi:5-aminolevulinate synthase
MSTSTRASPGGGTITNLQFIARRCPVMNKALAVQSARFTSRRSYGHAAAGTGVVKSLLEKKLHTASEKKASVDTNMFRQAQPGKKVVAP